MPGSRQLLAFALAASAIAATASATSFTSSQSGNWSSASTWGGAGVPGAGDSATVQAAHTITLDVSVTVANLTQSGTVTGAQSLTVTSAWNWNAGTQSGTGNTNIAPGGVLTIGGASNVTLDGRLLSNPGTINFPNGPAMFMQNNASLINSGTIDFQTDFTGIFLNTGTATVFNSGTIQKSGGSINNGNGSHISVPLTANPSSTLRVNSGNMTLGAVTSTGASFTVSAGTSLNFADTGSRSFDASSSISGAGTVVWGIGNNTVLGSYNITGATNHFSGATTMMSNVVSLGNVILYGGTLTLNGSSTILIPSLTLQGSSGILNGSAPIILTGSAMTWTGGTIGGTGSFAISGGTTVTTYLNTFDARPVTNAGTIILAAGAVMYFQNNAVLTNGGTIDIQGDGSISLNGTAFSTAVLNQSLGTIKKSAGTGTSTFNVPLTAGVGSQVLVQSGAMSFGTITSNGGSMSASSGATLNFTNNAYSNTRSFDASSLISATDVTWGDGANTVNGNYAVIGTTTVNGGTTTLTNTTSVGNVSIGGGTLTINGGVVPLSIPVLSMNGGTFTGNSPINVTGAAAMNWYGNTIAGTGAMTISAASTISQLFTTTLSGRPITNNGTINVSGTVNLANNIVLTNAGVIDLKGGSLLWSGSLGSTSVINAGPGRIRSSAGGLSGSLNVPLQAQIGSQVSAIGGGTLFLADVTSTGAAFTIASASYLAFQSTVNTRTFDGASTISGAGQVSWGAGTNTVNGNYNVTGSTWSLVGANTTLNSISSTGNITMQGGTLTLNSATPINVPTLTTNAFPPNPAPTLNGTAPINLTGSTMYWNGGTIGGNSSLTIPVGTTVNLIGQSITFDSRPVTNAGTFAIGGPYVAYLQNNAIFTNSGTIDIQGDGAVALIGAAGSTAVVNSGTIKKSAGTGISTFSVPLTAQSGSQFQVQTGFVTLSSVSATSSTFAISSNATLDFFYNVSRTLDAGSSISGLGTLQVDGGTSTINGSLNVSNLGLSSGTLTINTASTFNTITINGGTINGSGAITVTGTAMTWSGGTIAGTNTLTIPAAATISISGPLTFDSRPIANAGTLNVTGVLTIQNVAALTNGGTIDLKSNNGIALGAGSASIINNGVFRKSAGGGTSSVGASLINNGSGVVQVNAGTLSLTGGTANGGPYSVVSGSTLNFAGGTTIQATTTINGPGVVTNGGTISCPSGVSVHLQGTTLTNLGTINLTANSIDRGAGSPSTIINGGTLASNGASVLDATVNNQAAGTVEIDGGTLAVTGATFTNAGTLSFVIPGTTSFGRLNVTGAFTRAGTLKARPASGFSPSSGSTYQIFSFGSVGGSFAVNDVLFPGGVFIPSYTATTGTLTFGVKKTTSTTVVPAQNPALVGTSASFTVTVADSSGLGGTPSGSVMISSNSGESCNVAALDPTGSGNCSISFSAVGLKTLTANYNGDAAFDVSSGGTTEQIVGNTTTAINSVGTATPVVGQGVAINFAVSAASPAAGTPTGIVTVSDGTSNCGAVLNALGNGTCTWSSFTAGVHTLNASYAGDSNYNPSATTTGTMLTVGKANTIAVIVGQSAYSTLPGEIFRVDFWAQVVSPGAGAPTGTITVTDGVDTCTGTLLVPFPQASSCMLALSSVGSHTLTATYNGDSNFNSSPPSSSVSHTVNPPPPAINSINPAIGTTGGGQTVTINGQYLTGATSVTFGGSAAAINSNNDSSIGVTTPAHAAGPVNVVVNTPAGSVTSINGFNYIALTFSPNHGNTGTRVVLSGSSFTGTTSVKFNGVAAASFTVLSDTSLRAIVPAGATTGPIVVTTPNGPLSSANFTIVPQANRTFVSTHGNDANPCSPTMPCRGFTRALDATFYGGDIVVANSGGYGPVTIDKAITIFASDGVYAGITATGGDGIVINATPGDVIMLRGLTLNGVSGATNGIQISNGAALELNNIIINGFTTGINASGAERVHVYDSLIRGSTNTGISISTASGTTFLLVDQTRLEDNLEGINGGGGGRVILRRSQIIGKGSGSGAGVIASSATGSSEVTLERVSVSGTDTALNAGGSSECIIRVSRSTIIGNNVGVLATGGGSVASLGNNTLTGNGTDGTFNPLTAK